MKDKVKYLIIMFLVAFISFYELPYYIDAPGGLDNLNNKVKVENGYKSKGSINLTYVKELKATIPMLLIAKINPDWKIVPKKNSNIGTLDYESLMMRQQVLMKQSYTSAIKYAYEAANKNVNIEQEKCYVIYLFDESDANLKVGDQIISVDGQAISKCSDISEYVKTKKENEKSEFKVINKSNEFDRTVTYKLIDDKLAIGIQLGIEYVLDTEPKYNFEFNENEYGPSGGLMIALAVYNSLIETDITNGKTVAGTGTLESDGSVGPIGGVEYKLKGAVKKKADIFFVPSGENYEEAKKIKEKNNYKIELVEVKTFDEALKYLLNSARK